MIYKDLSALNVDRIRANNLISSITKTQLNRTKLSNNNSSSPCVTSSEIFSAMIDDCEDTINKLNPIYLLMSHMCDCSLDWDIPEYNRDASGLVGFMSSLEYAIHEQVSTSTYQLWTVSFCLTLSGGGICEFEFTIEASKTSGSWSLSFTLREKNPKSGSQNDWVVIYRTFTNEVFSDLIDNSAYKTALSLSTLYVSTAPEVADWEAELQSTNGPLSRYECAEGLSNALATQDIIANLNQFAIGGFTAKELSMQNLLAKYENTSSTNVQNLVATIKTNLSYMGEADVLSLDADVSTSYADSSYDGESSIIDWAPTQCEVKTWNVSMLVGTFANVATIIGSALFFTGGIIGKIVGGVLALGGNIGKSVYDWSMNKAGAYCSLNPKANIGCFDIPVARSRWASNTNPTGFPDDVYYELCATAYENGLATAVYPHLTVIFKYEKEVNGVAWGTFWVFVNAINNPKAHSDGKVTLGYVDRDMHWTYDTLVSANIPWSINASTNSVILGPTQDSSYLMGVGLGRGCSNVGVMWQINPVNCLDDIKNSISNVSGVDPNYVSFHTTDIFGVNNTNAQIGSVLNLSGSLDNIDKRARETFVTNLMNVYAYTNNINSDASSFRSRLISRIRDMYYSDGDSVIIPKEEAKTVPSWKDIIDDFGDDLNWGVALLRYNDYFNSFNSSEVFIYANKSIPVFVCEHARIDGDSYLQGAVITGLTAAVLIGAFAMGRVVVKRAIAKSFTKRLKQAQDSRAKYFEFDPKTDPNIHDPSDAIEVAQYQDKLFANMRLDALKANIMGNIFGFGSYNYYSDWFEASSGVGSSLLGQAVSNGYNLIATATGLPTTDELNTKLTAAVGDINTNTNTLRGSTSVSLSELDSKLTSIHKSITG